MEREVAWNHYSEEEKKKVFEFAEEYRKFISACKTERECVRTFVERAEAAGYLDIKKVIAEGIKLNPVQECMQIIMEKHLLCSL